MKHLAITLLFLLYTSNFASEPNTYSPAGQNTALPPQIANTRQPNLPPSLINPIYLPPVAGIRLPPSPPSLINSDTTGTTDKPTNPPTTQYPIYLPPVAGIRLPPSPPFLINSDTTGNTGKPTNPPTTQYPIYLPPIAGIRLPPSPPSLINSDTTGNTGTTDKPSSPPHHRFQDKPPSPPFIREQGDDTGDDTGDDKGDDKGDNKGDNKGDDTGDDKGDNKGDNKGDDTGDDKGDDTGDDKGDDTGDDKGDNKGDNKGDKGRYIERTNNTNYYDDRFALHHNNTARYRVKFDMTIEENIYTFNATKFKHRIMRVLGEIPLEDIILNVSAGSLLINVNILFNESLATNAINILNTISQSSFADQLNLTILSFNSLQLFVPAPLITSNSNILNFSNNDIISILCVSISFSCLCLIYIIYNKNKVVKKKLLDSTDYYTKENIDHTV